MNKALKEALIIGLSSIGVVGLIASGGISRIAYSLWDVVRTNDAINNFQKDEGSEETPAEDFRKQAFYKAVESTVSDGTLKAYDLLVMTSSSTYEISHYEEVFTGSGSYTKEFFHMMGAYEREGNLLTVTPGIGVYSSNANNAGFTHKNAEYLTKEDAGDKLSRDEVYALKYASTSFALMSDGSFVNGGTSDSEETIEGKEDIKVYSTLTTQGRINAKTLVTFGDGNYILYSQATNSNNHEQTTGAFWGMSTYTIADADKGIAPDPEKPEETYDIVKGEMGLGYMYANNNGSDMQFDLRAEGQFKQWLNMSFNAPTPTFYVTETGFTIKIGALKTVVEKWGLYVPAGEDTPVDPEKGEDIKLEVASSQEGKPFILYLNADGTMKTGWTNYEQTVHEGTWSMFGNSVVLNVDYPFESTPNASGGLDITLNFGQMGEKVFTMSAEQLSKAKASNSKPITLEVASSQEGKPFIFSMEKNGKLTTGWTNYEQTVHEGSWKVEDDELVFDVDYEVLTVSEEDGSTSIKVNYGQMGEKTYSLSSSLKKVLLDNAPAALKDIHLEVASSQEGKPFILDLRADGTLTTGWTNYEQTLHEGSWGVFGGNIYIEAEGYSVAIVQGESSANITIDYGQMGEKTFELAGKDYESAMLLEASIRLEVASSNPANPFFVEFEADGTVTTGWPEYAQTVKEGTWGFDGDDLKIEVEGYASTFSTSEEGVKTLTVDYGQMGQKAYAVSSSRYDVLKKASEALFSGVHMEVASSVEDKPFVLDLNKDGSATCGWTNYEAAMRNGSWKVFNEKLIIEVDGYSFFVSATADGGLSILANLGQMGEKTFAMAASDWNLAKTKSVDTLHYELGTSVEGKPFVLDFKADGSVSTGWTNYEQTILAGTYGSFNGNLVLSVGSYVSSCTKNFDGSLTLTINYGQMGTKDYNISATAAAALCSVSSYTVHAEVASSQEGKPFVLDLKEDGSVSTGWTNYEAAMKNGTWSYANGSLSINVEGYTATGSANEEGGYDLTVDYGQMGEKQYSISASDLALLKGSETLLHSEVATSVEGKPFILDFKADGSVSTGWTNFPQTMKKGTYAFSDGALKISVPGYSVTITAGEDGGYEVTINYGQMGEKTYSLSSEQIARITPSIA